MFSLHWTPSSTFCASSAHMGWGSAIWLLGLHAGFSSVWLFLAYVAGTAFKEFVADLTFLEQDSFAGSCLDFLTYQVGMGLGVVAFYWTWPGVAAAIAVVVVAAIIDYRTSKQRASATRVTD
jgi:hypothetical protein